MNERLGTMSIPLLITLAGLLIAYQFVDPAPPSELSIATGQSDGSYYSFGNRKQSAQNLTFLGSLYFEPLWLFHRSDFSMAQLSELRGKRIVIGPEGSGTRAIALQLLQDNGINSQNSALLPLAGKEAAQALASNKADAIFLVTSAKSLLIEQLLRTHGVRLMSFDRAEAYARNHPFLSPISLPEGVIDQRLHQATSKDEIRACISSLADIEHEVRQTHVPLSYTEELYELRTHLALVQSLAE